jgi:hypothetical protein
LAIPPADAAPAVSLPELALPAAFRPRCPAGGVGASFCAAGPDTRASGMAGVAGTVAVAEIAAVAAAAPRAAAAAATVAPVGVYLSPAGGAPLPSWPGLSFE